MTLSPTSICSMRFFEPSAILIFVPVGKQKSPAPREFAAPPSTPPKRPPKKPPPPDCVVVCVLVPLPAMPASAFVVAPFKPIDAFHARNAGFCAASCAAAASAMGDPAILARFPKSPLFAEALPCAFAHCCCARFAC